MKRFGNIFFTCIFFLILIIGNIDAIKKIPQMHPVGIVFISIIILVILSFAFFCIRRSKEEAKRFFGTLDNIDNISKRLDNIEKELNKS